MTMSKMNRLKKRLEFLQLRQTEQYRKMVRAREDLVAKGFLEDTGERRLNPAGEFEPVWRITERGVAMVEEEILGLPPDQQTKFPK
jgi:hypothetical protein